MRTETDTRTLRRTCLQGSVSPGIFNGDFAVAQIYFIIVALNIFLDAQLEIVAKF